MAAAGEFVDGWLVAEVLGEGAYGEVRLLVHAGSGARVALKAVRGAAGAREAALHRALRHPHVLRCLGSRAAAPPADAHYLFLEVADGGELFERIVPDRGMPAAAARRYWRQLAAGLRYLHGRGVAHRDIKPENLLLTARDDLKLADFGLATLFRHGARERLLTAAAGTPPYAAPEVLAAAQRPYRAAPADTWAAAIVMLAMLAGELPWERAAESDARYGGWVRWVEAETGTEGSEPPPGPWGKLGRGALCWLRGALRPPHSRDTLHRLLLHPWMCDGESEAGAGGGGAGARGWSSQPAGGGGGEAPPQHAMAALLSLSQPAQAEELLESGGAGGRLRLTRVELRPGVGEEEAVRALQGALRERRMGWAGAPPSLLVEAGGGVRLRVAPRRVAAGLVLEFRRAAGCGLQFTRRFHELKAALAHIARPDREHEHEHEPQPMDADDGH